MLTVTEVGVPSALRDTERVGIGGTGHELVVRGACRVGPGAVGTDREGAVAAGRAGLRHEGRRTVDVAVGQRAAGGERRIGLGEVDRADDSTAASLVPWMFTVTEVSVPSARRHERVGIGRAGNELVVCRVAV